MEGIIMKNRYFDLSNFLQQVITHTIKDIRNNPKKTMDAIKMKFPFL